MRPDPPLLARTAGRVPGAVERRNDEPARSPRGSRADQTAPRSGRPPRSAGRADPDWAQGVRVGDRHPGVKGGARRLGAQRAREKGPERPPAPDDDHLRRPRTVAALMAAIEAR